MSVYVKVQRHTFILRIDHRHTECRMLGGDRIALK